MAWGSVCLSAIVLAALISAPVNAAPARVRLPFVGCASNGQIGPEPAPKGHDLLVRLELDIAARLAFYRSNYDSVIAPRGWHCVALEGSNGSILFVTPQARAAEDVMLHHSDIKGPAIQLTTSLGSTSGRFEVAEIAARYFPKFHAFTDGVVAEGIEPVADFVSGPYPADRFIRHTARLVEVETPPRAKGLGTKSRLVPDGLPIRSVAILSDDEGEPNATLLTVKLPPELRDLLPAIVAQVH